MKILLVIAFGVLVGVGIELVLARRQRARRVEFAEPDLPPGFGDVAPRRRSGRRGRGPAAADASIVIDDDGGVRILGPVTYEGAPSMPWDATGGEGEQTAVGDGATGDDGPAGGAH